MKKKEYKEKVKNLLLELGEFLLGNDGKKLIELLYGKKDVNEFNIAKKMKLNINQVRNMLYKFSNRNLVSTIRRRDKKSGWYIYYWTLDESRALEELRNIKLKKLDEIEREIKSKQTTTFYSCQNKCLMMKEETALLHDFFCPECGELTMPISMDKEIKKLEMMKNKIQKSIENINNILDLMYEKEKEERKKKKKKVVKKKEKKAKKVKEKKKTKVKRVKPKKVSRKKVKKVKKKSTKLKKKSVKKKPGKKKTKSIKKKEKKSKKSRKFFGLFK